MSLRCGKIIKFRGRKFDPLPADRSIGMNTRGGGGGGHSTFKWTGGGGAAGV